MNLNIYNPDTRPTTTDFNLFETTTGLKKGILPSHQLLWFLASIYLEPLISQRWVPRFYLLVRKTKDVSFYTLFLWSKRLKCSVLEIKEVEMYQRTKNNEKIETGRLFANYPCVTKYWIRTPNTDTRPSTVFSGGGYRWWAPTSGLSWGCSCTGWWLSSITPPWSPTWTSRRWRTVRRFCSLISYLKIFEIW